MGAYEDPEVVRQFLAEELEMETAARVAAMQNEEDCDECDGDVLSPQRV